MSSGLESRAPFRAAASSASAVAPLAMAVAALVPLPRMNPFVFEHAPHIPAAGAASAGAASAGAMPAPVLRGPVRRAQGAGPRPDMARMRGGL